jgi:hypothetical protein
MARRNPTERAMRDARDAAAEFRKRFAARRSKGTMTPRDHAVIRADTPPDVTSTRAKSQRHGKVTADHWNQ